MSQWITTALPIATLALGSALTMAGQALIDRRKEARDRRARREEFQNNNFEMHRSAMLSMQEIARDCFDSVANERVRREGSEYEYFESRRLKNLKINNAPAAMKSVEEVMAEFKDAGFPEDKRAEVSYRLINGMLSFTEASEELTRTMADFMRLTQERFPFLGDLRRFVHQLRLCMYRSGSNSVIYCGEKYIQAVMKWDGYLSSGGAANPYNEVRMARIELDRALSNALTYGPYDRYEGTMSQAKASVAD